MNKMRRLKIQLMAAVFLLVVIIAGGLLLSLPMFRNVAWALSANYSKTMPGGTLDVSEWNNLAADFVAKSGDAMTGILDMGGNRIANLATPTVASPGTDAANKQYVDNAMVAVGGSAAGSVFTNWGSETCPTGTTRLYFGVAFSAIWTSVAGGNNPVCINQAGTAGGLYATSNADKMYPLVTGSGSELPTSIVDAASTITGARIVKCAVCHRSAGSCYESFGAFTCGTGFTPFYTGYVLGSQNDLSANVGTSNSPTNRACVNRSFDATSATASVGAKWIGTRIEDDFGAGYTEGSFIRCAYCCN